MQQTSATRMSLLTKQSQLSLATQGAGLLRNKREALLQELIVVLKPLVEAHCRLYESLRKARQSLFMAEAFKGTHSLTSLALALHRRIDLDLVEYKFWGARIPELIIGQVKRSAAQLNAIAPGLGAGAGETTEDFEDAFLSLLQLLPMEMKLTRLGEEIRKTSRRVNALDQIMIPRLKAEIKQIRQMLEEVEREDVFRLRRIKKGRG